MTNATTTQIRGHCQCCGNLQAVPTAHMSKHGYTVKGGWFSGVCSGQNYAPIEVSRETADKIVAQVRADVAALYETIEALRSGKVFPKTAFTGHTVFVNGKRVSETVPFAEASDYKKAQAVESAIYTNQSRAKAGEQFAQSLHELCNQYHGQPLIQVTKPAAAAPIQAGERRVLNGVVRTAKQQDGARVYWTYVNGSGQKFTSWTGSKAWRALPLAE